MPRKPTTRETVLLGGLSILGVVLLYRFLTPDMAGLDLGTDDPLGAGGASDAPVVQMALLTRDPEPYAVNGRDLFKYAQRPPTPPELEARRRAEEERRRRLAEEAERRRLAAEAERMRLAAERAQRSQAPPPRPVGLTPPQVRFEYLGYLGPKDDRIAVFEDGEEILLARAGDTVEQDFLIREIAYQKVVIGYTKDEFEGRTTELRMKDK